MVPPIPQSDKDLENLCRGHNYFLHSTKRKMFILYMYAYEEERKMQKVGIRNVGRRKKEEGIKLRKGGSVVWKVRAAGAARALTTIHP